ncbi:MAG: efflux RND transporter periplasmic adaptor subunit [Acidobacteriota bacterium]
MIRRLVVVLTLSLAAGAAACSDSGGTVSADAPAPETPAVDVPVVTVSSATVESALQISGTLAPRARVGVKPRLPGALDQVLVDIGDRVSVGQVVATIDRREIDAQADAAQAAVAVARAALATADAALANAVTELERARNLFEAGALPRQRLDAADTAHRAAAAQRDLAAATVAQAEATLRRAREVQRDATVTAPVAGYVVERNYDAGAMPGDRPIVVIADLSELRLEAGVSELEAGRLVVGLAAEVTVQARPGATYAGRLAAIAPEVDERNRHFKVEVRVPNSDRALLSGMYASARLVVDSAPDALVVPREAVTDRNGRRVVLKVSGDTVGAAEVVEGLTDGRVVQITAGVAAGDLVLADARRPLAAGARVKPVPVTVK